VAKILNNTFKNNNEYTLEKGMIALEGGVAEIKYNTFQNNNEGSSNKGTIFTLSQQSKADIGYNNIINNTFTNYIFNWQSNNIDFIHNYYGTADSVIIQNKIFDYYDNVSYGKAVYEPYALAELKFDGTDIFSQPQICISWTYSNWSACSNNGQQTRSIISSSPSSCAGGNPILTQSCTYVPSTCTSWTYSNWNSCNNGQQTRTIISSSPTNCAGGNPVLSQSCNSTPLCTEDNWISELSPTICPSNGQQTKKWTKIGQCQNGVLHSFEEIASCNYQTPTCASFTYSDWGVCNSSGVQSRNLLSSYPANCAGGNTILSRSCVYTAPICTSWTFTNWSNCINGQQSRTITSSQPTNCSGGNPILGQTCNNTSSQQNNTNDNIINNNLTNNNNSTNNSSTNNNSQKLLAKIDKTLSKKLTGKLLLQVEQGGSIWYVDTKEFKRYSVTWANALPLFKKLSLGITDANLAKIPIYGSSQTGSTSLRNQLKGRLLLQVEQGGSIWYVDQNGYRHSVTWNNLMDLFKKLSLGITDANLNKIEIGSLE
jgi:hypothetical protein